jgi:hypothetical protein
MPYPYSFMEYTGNGSLKNYTVPPYLAKSHITVTLDDVTTTAFTWLSGSQLSFINAPAAGVKIRISRSTSPDTPLVSWQTASVNTKALLNKASLQQLYLLQENADAIEGMRAELEATLGGMTLDTSAGSLTLEGTLTSGTQVIRNTAKTHSATLSVNSVGDLTVAQDSVDKLTINSTGYVLPGIDNTLDIGSATKLWRNCYIQKAYIYSADKSVYTSFITDVNGLNIRINGGNSALSVFQTVTRPGTDNTALLGGPSYRWAGVYASTGTVSTSDGREKTDIIDEPLGLSFIESLRPRQFRYIDGGGHPGVRPHHGLIAQEVKETLDSLGTDHAGFIESPLENGETRLGLRYSELISSLIKAVQELSTKVRTLEART